MSDSPTSRLQESPVLNHPHTLSPGRLSHDPIIMIVGAGGTGGFLAEALCRLMTGRSARITIVDHDHVEPHNLLRQNFYPEDVGKPKSLALASRLSSQYQRPISYSTTQLTADRASISPRPSPPPNLFIACVDNAQARIGLDRYIDGTHNAWLIDAGNGENWGQVLIGNAHSPHFLHRSFSKGQCRSLPTPIVQRPDLSIDPPDHRPDIDCAAALDLTDQDPTINQLMASLTVQTVRRLISGNLTYMALYADQAAGTVVSTPATPRNVARITGIPITDLLCSGPNLTADAPPTKEAVQHPSRFLPPDGSLTQEHYSMLDQACTFQEPDPEDPTRTIFTFTALHWNDTRDRTIVADPNKALYTTERAPGCVCATIRAPVHCHCLTVPCSGCEQPFIALNPECKTEYCIQEQCDLCWHQREECNADEFEARIIHHFETAAAQEEPPAQAAAMYNAIVQELGANDGRAPNLPIARRILTDIFQADANAEAWSAPDGSIIRVSESDPARLVLPDTPTLPRGATHER